MTESATRTNILAVFISVIFLLCLGAAVWYDKYYFVAIPFGFLVVIAGWINIRTVFFLLIFSLPFSIEWQFNPELGTDLPDEMLMLLTAWVLVAYWLYKPGIIQREFRVHPLFVLLLISVAWSAATISASEYPLISIKYLLAKGWYIGAFVLAPLVVFQQRKNIRIAMIILAGAMLAVVIITLVRHATYGFSFAHINDALRPFFRNHVNYSAMLVCIIPVFFAFYKLTESFTPRAVIVSCIIILLVALFLSYARGAWLALVIGLIVYWLVKRKLLLGVYIACIVVSAGAVFWLKMDARYMNYAHHYRETIFHEDFREHLRATYQLKDLSTQERFYRWIAGVRMINERPVTGFGPNTFYNNYKPYAVPAFKTWVSANKEHSTVHNYFLLVAIEQGIPGLLIFLLLVGSMLYYAQTIYHRATDIFDKTVSITIGVVLMMILTVNSLSDLIETDKIGSLFFICLSLLMITDFNSKQTRSDSSPDVQSVS